MIDVPVRERLLGVLVEVRNAAKRILRDDRGLTYECDRHMHTMSKLSEQIAVALANFRRNTAAFNETTGARLQAL